MFFLQLDFYNCHLKILSHERTMNKSYLAFSWYLSLDILCKTPILKTGRDLFGANNPRSGANPSRIVSAKPLKIRGNDNLDLTLK